MISSILQAIGLFIATNIDDIVILSLFFGRGQGQPGITRRILAGQYLGFVELHGATGSEVDEGATTHSNSNPVIFANG